MSARTSGEHACCVIRECDRSSASNTKTFVTPNAFASTFPPLAEVVQVAEVKSVCFHYGDSTSLTGIAPETHWNIFDFFRLLRIGLEKV